jgi:acyl carrier protein
VSGEGGPGEIERQVAAFFLEELQVSVTDYDQDLRATGLLDSFNMIQVMQFAETLCEGPIDIEDVDLNAFNTVRSIAAQIVRWQGH